MSKGICLMGESGSGKTTSLRNLDPASTVIIDCDKKGLSWKGWRDQYNSQKGNYYVTDFPQTALKCLKSINEKEKNAHVKVVVFDTINGLMVADEMRRMREKGFDKWQDLATCIYELIDYSLNVRSDLTPVFIAHIQTERDDNGNAFSRIKTSGRKLDKITLESKFSTVLYAMYKDGNYIFRTHTDGSSTAKSPMGAFENDEIPNDLNEAIKALEDF